MLPTELFIPIFQHVLGVPALFVHSSEQEVPDSAAYYNALQNLRLVCACWNQISTSTSSLWCLIDLSQPEGAVVQRLDRSAPTPLVVVLRDSKAEYANLTQNAYRIRVLRLSGTDQLVYLILEALFRAGMPLLRVLEMISPRRLDFSAHEEDGSDTTWLQNLHTIFIKRLWLSPKFLSCTSLRFLHLYKLKAGTQFIGQLISQNPELTELYIGTITQSAGVHTTLRLPKLRRLTLSSVGPANMKEFLTHLDIPACISWHIDFSGDDADQFGPIATELKKHLKSPPSLLSYDDASLKLADGSEGLTVSRKRIKYVIRLNPISRLSALLKDIFQIFLVPLRTLKMEGPGPIPIDLLRDEAVSDHLTDIQYLHLNRIPSTPFREICAFLAAENPDAEWNPKRWPLSRLTSIEIRHDCDRAAIDALHLMETRRRTDGIQTTSYGFIPLPLKFLRFKHLPNEGDIRKVVEDKSWWNMSIKIQGYPRELNYLEEYAAVMNLHLS